MDRAISNAHSGFLADQPSQVVFSHLLAQLLQVTDCEYGFVGDKLYGEDGKPYLKTRALTNIRYVTRIFATRVMDYIHCLI